MGYSDTVVGSSGRMGAYGGDSKGYMAIQRELLVERPLLIHILHLLVSLANHPYFSQGDSICVGTEFGILRYILLAVANFIHDILDCRGIRISTVVACVL